MPETAPLSQLEKRLAPLFNQAIQKGVFSGAAVGLSLGVPEHRSQTVYTYGTTGRKTQQQAVDRDTCFDLASLTKPLATTLGVLSLLREGKVRLTDPLPLLLAAQIPPDKQGITLQHLLSHSSGLPAHRPYYQQLVHLEPAQRRQHLLTWLLAEPLLAPPGRQSVYSDLGFLLLGWIIEETTGQRLDQWAGEHLYRPLGLAEQLFFLPHREAKPERRYAATEECPWRRKLLVGEVHDDNAHALGGVEGHAGLFGTADGVLRLATHLLDVWRAREQPAGFRASDLRHFLTTRPVPDSTWVLGFDTPSAAGSSTGRFFSPASVGHLGFTGTSFWIDPEKELVVVLLTNRVHPDRLNEQIKVFRPRFHDVVVEGLGLV